MFKLCNFVYVSGIYKMTCSCLSLSLNLHLDRKIPHPLNNSLTMTSYPRLELCPLSLMIDSILLHCLYTHECHCGKGLIFINQFCYVCNCASYVIESRFTLQVYISIIYEIVLTFLNNDL